MAATAATAGPLVTPDLPADERQAQPAEVHAERAAGVERVASCVPGGRSRARSARSARCLSGSSTSRTDRSGACGVDRHARPRSRSRRRPGSRRRARRRRERPLARTTARAPRNLRATSIRARASAFRDPEASALTPRERRDVEVGTAVEERRELSREIGIAEEQRARRRLRVRLRTAPGPFPDVAAARRSHPLLRLRLPCRRASRRRPRSPRRRETSAAASRRSPR